MCARRSRLRLELARDLLNPDHDELRRLDASYRIFQPAIQVLGRVNRAIFRDSLNEIQRQIQAAGLPRFWLAEEYIARAEIVAFLITPLYLYLWVRGFGSTGVLAALLSTLVTVWLLRIRLARQAARRLLAIKRRMPFLLDLLTLLMEAGSTFLGALNQAVEDLAGAHHHHAAQLDRQERGRRGGRRPARSRRRRLRSLPTGRAARGACHGPSA